MKTLLLMRHAKSSWKDSKQKDKDRPLSKRGKKNAIQIGELIKDRELIPELLLSSSAKRARETTELVVGASGYTSEVTYLDHLFMAEPDVILDALRLLPDTTERVLVVGHNPGLESLLQILTGQIESLPTAALACLFLPVKSWKEINKDTEASLGELWRPKDLE